MTFGPAGIHAVQHFTPVLSLGAACTGMEGKNGIVGIIFAQQQSSQFASFQIVIQGFKAFLQLIQHGIIFHLQCQITQGQQILLLGAQVLIPFNLILQCLGALQDFLRLFHIIPEARLAGTVFQFFYFFCGVLQIIGLPQLVDCGLETIELLPVFFKFNECQG